MSFLSPQVTLAWLGGVQGAPTSGLRCAARVMAQPVTMERISEVSTADILDSYLT